MKLCCLYYSTSEPSSGILSIFLRNSLSKSQYIVFLIITLLTWAQSKAANRQMFLPLNPLKIYFTSLHLIQTHAESPTKNLVGGAKFYMGKSRCFCPRCSSPCCKSRQVPSRYICGAVHTGCKSKTIMEPTSYHMFLSCFLMTLPVCRKMKETT